jgi:hypothetical protein
MPTYTQMSETVNKPRTIRQLQADAMTTGNKVNPAGQLPVLFYHHTQSTFLKEMERGELCKLQKPKIQMQFSVITAEFLSIQPSI